MSDIKEDKSEILHYDNPDFQVYLRKNYIPQGMEFTDTSAHWHDEVEFICVLKGNIGYMVDGRRFLLKEGEGLFVNSRHLHCILKGTADCELLCLIFPPVLLCNCPYIAGKYVEPLLKDDKLPYLLLKEKTGWQLSIMDDISRMYLCLGKPEGELEILLHLYDLWRQLAKHARWQPAKETESDGELMSAKTMIGFIRKNYEEQLSLNDICESGSMGKNKCTSLFHKYTNMSPMVYLRFYRVEKSKELLRQTDMTITEIAYATGFAGASYYAESFRRYAGCSPMQYRIRYRTALEEKIVKE